MWARQFTCLTFVLAALASPSASHGWAEAYPSQALRLVVPFEGDGGTNILARQSARSLADQLHPSIIVDNCGGAAGIIGTEAVAPDGYTMLFEQVGPLAIVPSLHDNLPYDPFKDFVSVMLIGTQSH